MTGGGAAGRRDHRTLYWWAAAGWPPPTNRVGSVLVFLRPALPSATSKMLPQSTEGDHALSS